MRLSCTGNVTGTNGVTLAPFTSGQAITVTNTEAGFVSAASLVNVTAPDADDRRQHDDGGNEHGADYHRGRDRGGHFGGRL